MRIVVKDLILDITIPYIHNTLDEVNLFVTELDD